MFAVNTHNTKLYGTKINKLHAVANLTKINVHNM